MSGSSFEHQEQAKAHAQRHAIRCAVLTVSDTRTTETDTGGATIIALLGQAGFTVHERSLVKDQPEQIAPRLEQWLADPSVHAILTTGGTGIAKRDTTIEVVRRLLTVELEGFGELFRMLSWTEVGAASMMSRAVGGLVSREVEAGGDTFIFAMPGSVNAVETAMTKLIVPQLAHLVWERRK
ncbi:MAG TPA: MogA/MoaB family molybdenum cofactor biosynthesis protein [Phycisphaerales bacterium]|nr:MogA/MoaB family molybdenum cofactor biosynthesis protein [Phycisphaerales bacterium]HRQ76580.1 MogA/MoaB family molybdenum cofactor biosynthesis protein [Phycisphaerales bacterium]